MELSTFALNKHLLVGDNLHGSLADLGGDVQGLEEAGGGGLHAGVAGGNNDIARGDGTNASRGLDAVLVKNGGDLGQIGVREQQGGVASQEAELLALREERLVILGRGRALGAVLDNLRLQRLLAHDDLGLAAEVTANLVCLLGADVVHLAEHHLVVLVEALVDALLVVQLGLGDGGHGF